MLSLFKNIVIFVLLLLRMLHGSEAEKVYSIVFTGSAVEIVTALNSEKTSLNAPHSKKKVRISSSLQDRKNKFKAAAAYGAPYKNCLFAAVTDKKVSYFKKKHIFSLGCCSLLYRFHLF